MMFSSNTHEMLRRKAEQEADLQHAIEVELQRRRLLTLQLPERENESIQHFQRSLSIGSSARLPLRFNHSLLFQTESNMEEITGGCCRRLYPLHQGLQKLGDGFPAELSRSRKRRIGKQARSEIKKDKIGDCGASASTEVPLCVLFQKELAKKKSKHLRNKRRREDDDDNCMVYHDDITIAQLIKSRKKTGGDEAESLGKRSRFEDSEIFQKLASGDDETVKPQELEQMGEENDEEETGSKTEKVTVPIPSYGNNSSESPTGSNGGLVDIVVSPPETRQNSGCDDEIDVNDINAEKKNMVDDGANEAECLVHEYSEKQISNENKDEDDDDDDDERLKLAIHELALNLEARIMKVEKTLAKIKEWKTNKALAK